MHSEFHNFILLNFYILLILILKIILKINYENETNSNFIENIKVENITSCLWSESKARLLHLVSFNIM